MAFENNPSQSGRFLPVYQVKTVERKHIAASTYGSATLKNNLLYDDNTPIVGIHC